MGKDQDLQRRNHELSVLNEISRELNRSVNLDETLEFTLEQVAKLRGLSSLGAIGLRYLGSYFVMNVAELVAMLAALAIVIVKRSPRRI